MSGLQEYRFNLDNSEKIYKLERKKKKKNQIYCGKNVCITNTNMLVKLFKFPQQQMNKYNSKQI